MNTNYRPYKYPPGSVIKVFRWTKMVYHYGVYTDQGTVIDHTIDGIAERSLTDFQKDETPVIVNESDSEEQKESTLENAYYALKNYAELPYKLFKLNCEHFVNWCRRGVFESKQVQTGLVLGAILAVGVGAYLYNRSQQSDD